MKASGVRPYIWNSMDTTLAPTGTTRETPMLWEAMLGKSRKLRFLHSWLAMCSSSLSYGIHLNRVDLKTGKVLGNWTNLWNGTGGIVG